MIKSQNILITDDDEMIRTLSERILLQEGFQVVTADSGAAGLAAFSVNPGSFALAIIDESMTGMTGQETLSEIRKLRPGFPCVISSGHTLLKSDILPELRGNTHIMGKPYKSSELKKMVKTVIAGCFDEENDG